MGGLLGTTKQQSTCACWPAAGSGGPPSHVKNGVASPEFRSVGRHERDDINVVGQESTLPNERLDIERAAPAGKSPASYSRLRSPHPSPKAARFPQGPKCIPSGTDSPCKPPAPLRSGPFANRRSAIGGPVFLLEPGGCK